MTNLKIMWTFSWTAKLVYNLISIIPNYDLYNLQKFEENIDCFSLLALILTLFPTSLDGFSLASLLKLYNPSLYV